MFKFLKRLRGSQPEAVAEVAVPQEQASSAEATSAEAPVAAPIESTAEIILHEPIQNDTQVAPVAAQAAPIAEAVQEVELPKRNLGDSIRSLFVTDIEIEDLEDILIRADFGVDAASEIAEELQARARKMGAVTDPELRLILKELLTERLTREDAALNLSSGKLPYVFLVVGVNGAGKTTTIGKLARWLKDGDWTVVLGAADTFRAAAVEQLATWAQRSEAKLVRPETEGQDPASVAYQCVEKAIQDDADIAIIDTAGRLQNKKDLMDELGKIRRAVEKQASVSEVLLVIDSTMGQNAMAQAKAFAEVANVTGVVMTKLDGTAKGGFVYAIQNQLNLPVKLVGVGEGIQDFAFFSPVDFATGLVARPKP